MKERPILISAPMIRATLSGSKTQTRREIKWSKRRPIDFVGGKGDWNDPSCWGWSHDDGYTLLKSDGEPDCYELPCPYGQAGDQLWVREAFSGPHCMDASDGCKAVPPSKWGDCSRIWYWADGNPTEGDWTRPRPSIHMPRWASRITLEIVSVRVERLQDISEEDAAAEGIYRESEDEIPFNGPWYINAGDSQGYATAKSCYAALWDIINGEGSWEKNPWVWVIEFRRILP